MLTRPWCRLVGALQALATVAVHARSPFSMPLHGLRLDESNLVVDLFVGPHLLSATTAAVHMLVLTSPPPPHDAAAQHASAGQAQSSARRWLMGRRPDAWYAAQGRPVGSLVQSPDAGGLNSGPIAGSTRKGEEVSEAVLHFHDGTTNTMANGVFEIPVALIGSGASTAADDANRFGLSLSMPVTVEWRGQRFTTRAGTWPWQQRDRRYTVANACMVLNLKCGRLLDAASPGRCMKDWVEWHRMMGVEHFFVYDNNSDDDSAFYRALKPYVTKGIVTLIDYPVSLGGSDPGGGPTQRFQIMHAQLAFARRAQWMAFFDADEFVMPPSVLQPGGDYHFGAARVLTALSDARRATSSGPASDSGYFSVHSVMHNAQHPETCEPTVGSDPTQQRTVRLSACTVYRSERRGNPKPFLHAAPKATGGALTSVFDLACLTDTKGLPHNAPGCFEGGRARDPLFEGLPFLHFAVNHGCHGTKGIHRYVLADGPLAVGTIANDASTAGSLAAHVDHRRQLRDQGQCTLNTSVASSAAVRALEATLAAIDLCGADDPTCVPNYPQFMDWQRAQTGVEKGATSSTAANLSPGNKSSVSIMAGTPQTKTVSLTHQLLPGAPPLHPPSSDAASAASSAHAPDAPAVVARSPPHTPTSQCLASTSYLGEGRFHWLRAAGDVHSSSGECGAVQSAFGLCSVAEDQAPPSRECLLARVPWQTHMKVAQCCFACCVDFWQRRLGLVDVFNHWFENPQFKDVVFYQYFERPIVPSLSTVLLFANSVKRFSLFMQHAVKGHGQFKVNATHLAAVQRVQGGGVVNMVSGFISDKRVTEYMNGHATSAYLYNDRAQIPWKSYLATLPFTKGGHFYTTNSGDDASAIVRTIPLGARLPEFESRLARLGPRQNRTDLLMCCCMNDRRGRLEKVHALAATGACADASTNQMKSLYVNEQELMERMSRAKFVLSPSGAGYSCYRDTEVVASGAVPVFDGHLSGGVHVFDESFPAIHVPVCMRPPPLNTPPHQMMDEPAYCDPQALTPAFFEREYAKLEARRDELDTAKIYWPYWLYHVFKMLPDPGE